ncbi:MAG: DUF5058 family protein [Ignavibacteriales bacterium]
MDWKQIANEPWIWFCGFVTAAFGLYQAWFFYRRAIYFMRKYGGFQDSEVRATVRASVITAIGPVLAEIFVMIALAVAISPGLCWQREGVGVGSVFTELIQASNAAIAAGEQFGTPQFTIMGFATAVFIMNVAGWGWSVEAIFTRYIGKARDRLTGGNPKILTVIATCGMIAIFSYYSINNAVKGGGVLVAVITGLAMSMLMFRLADWIKRPHLKEWALGIAMFLGMFAGHFATVAGK